MKHFKLLNIALLLCLTIFSCSSDDDATFVPTGSLPVVINEEEVITTLNVTLTPVGGGTTVTLQTQDLDGDGPNAPVITVSDDLVNGKVYNGTIELLNETVNPAEDITEEVETESNEHQFFYTAGTGLDISTTYENFDINGENLGTEFTLTTNTVSSGTLTFTLRHEPTKPNTGLADAGGETDISATFDIVIN